MKKSVLFIAFAFGFSCYSNAQISMKKLNSEPTSTIKAPSTTFDVNGLTSQIVNSLQPKLKLTNDQVPQVTNTITGLLNKKKKAIPLITTDKAGYSSIMTGIQSAFPSKMKTILKPEQYSSLLSLIPKKPSSTNILSKMLF